MTTKLQAAKSPGRGDNDATFRCFLAALLISLTPATHVGAGNITLSETSYAPLAGTTVQLTNNTIGRTTNTGLLMFQLASMPAGLGPLTLASTAPTLGAGRDCGNFTRWTVFTNSTPWTWTEVSSGGNFIAYQKLAASAMHLGRNTVGTTGFRANATNGVPDIKPSSRDSTTVAPTTKRRRFSVIPGVASSRRKSAYGS